MSLQDALLLCVRVPKSGSTSLDAALREALADRRAFYLPNTLDLDGRLSNLQRLRFQRGRARNLLIHYRSPRLARAFDYIQLHAAPGDLLCGGHADFASVQTSLPRRVKIISILRNPFDRCRSEYWYARRNYFRKSGLGRLDSGKIPQIAATHDFHGYIDFLMDHRHIYGDIAAKYLGITPCADLVRFFEQHVFHTGLLEESDRFAELLGEKLGRRVHFPRLNATGGANHIELTVSAKLKIEQVYSRDFEIYEHVMSAARQTAVRPGRIAAA